MAWLITVNIVAVFLVQSEVVFKTDPVFRDALNLFMVMQNSMHCHCIPEYHRSMISLDPGKDSTDSASIERKVSFYKQITSNNILSDSFSH